MNVFLRLILALATASARATTRALVAAILATTMTATSAAADESCDKNHYILGWNCSPSKATPADHLVGLGDDECGRSGVCFYPARLTIKAGDTVTFYPYDSMTFNGPRNVAADDGSFRCANGCDGEGGNGNPARPPWQFTRTFRVPGVVAYHDETSGAAGVIEVQEADASPQAPFAVEYMYRWGDFRFVSSYFVTSHPAEIELLDRAGQWWRTGESFGVWNNSESGTLPTCRFVNTVYGSHFFTPYEAECAALRAADVWLYEGPVFGLRTPDADGNCPVGAAPLYRLYNRSRLYPIPTWGGGEFFTTAPLHRYTTRVQLVEQLSSAGWLVEGDARTAAFACVPAPPPGAR